MRLIYNLIALDYYSYESFNHLCSHIKILKYDFLKLYFNELIKIHLHDIKKICEKNNLELIISFKTYTNLKDYYNIIDNIEIFDYNIYDEIHNKFKFIVLNIEYNNLKNIKNSNYILINDPDEIDDFDIFKNENIGIEIENHNDIWYNILNIKLFSIINFNNIINNEWSFFDNIKIDNISSNFLKFISKKKKKIIITGITGQDGSILGEYLININDKDIIVIGTVRSISVLKHENIIKIINNKYFCPILLDLSDKDKTEYIFKYIKPDYFFNCAAQVTVYNTTPYNIENTFFINTISPLRHLEYINKYCKNCKYLSCGSSEEFGNIKYTPQDLNHPCNPINIYGITKNTTHNIVKYFRENLNIFCCHVVLYNHESTRRSINFVTRKITNEIAKIKIDMDNNIIPKSLKIGNINSKRDWSCAEDFIKAFWKILNHDVPNDYILSSGETHTIKEMIDIAFNYVKLPLTWNINNNIFDTKAYHNDILMIEISKDYYRDNDDLRYFKGDNSETINKLNWDIETNFENLIKDMIDNDLKILHAEKE